ncbi:MAG TPA: hypothetical protein ENK28_04955 [Aliiroseovarius sp.]|nr:hypothetical protein [Aliiroseovarius sp.]
MTQTQSAKAPKGDDVPAKPAKKEQAKVQSQCPPVSGGVIDHATQSGQVVLDVRSQDRAFVSLQNPGKKPVTIKCLPKKQMIDVPGVGQVPTPEMSLTFDAGQSAIMGPFAAPYIGAAGTVTLDVVDGNVNLALILLRQKP